MWGDSVPNGSLQWSIFCLVCVHIRRPDLWIHVCIQLYAQSQQCVAGGFIANSRMMIPDRHWPWLKGYMSAPFSVDGDAFLAMCGVADRRCCDHRQSRVAWWWNGGGGSTFCDLFFGGEATSHFSERTRKSRNFRWEAMMWSREESPRREWSWQSPERP